MVCIGICQSWGRPSFSVACLRDRARQATKYDRLPHGTQLARLFHEKHKVAVQPVSHTERQNLLIDADDTLWENNIYFEQAFESFCDFLAHSSLTPPEVRSVLDEIEIANARVHGYGSKNFGHNLKQCYQHLAEREIRADDLARVMRFAEEILEQPIELIDGVPETLEYLATRHDLTLFTKGDPEEQKLKVQRSGLGIYFGHTAIVKEKNAAAYRALVRDRRLAPERTWMELERFSNLRDYFALRSPDSQTP